MTLSRREFLLHSGVLTGATLLAGRRAWAAADALGGAAASSSVAAVSLLRPLPASLPRGAQHANAMARRLVAAARLGAGTNDRQGKAALMRPV